jgi:lipid A ethanolaminephosphotransferase
MDATKPKKVWLTPNQYLMLAVSAFIMLTGNFSFYHKVTEVYPWADGNAPFLISLLILFTAVTAFLLNLLTYRKANRWVLAVFLVASSAAAYFMDKYGTVIDYEMLINLLQTNVSEAGDLFNINMALRLVLLGLLPAVLVIKYRPITLSHTLELRSKVLTAVALLLVMGSCIAPFTSQYASFFRAHKTLRFYANPTYFTYSLVRLIDVQLKDIESGPPEAVATNTQLNEPENSVEHKELIVMVVGETARADRFSLNGYHRPTNPLLEKESIVSLKNVTSCGTSTAVSVPCMFSNIKMSDFSIQKASKLENVLDVLKRKGVEILWRDNNSDSKGVALRVDYQDYRNPKNNPVCDEECRDEGMIQGLEEYVKARQGKDILIVLHQMGNHGPAYYKRYPKEFEKFTPVCKTNELSKCSQQEIDNAYDNAILYTDYFLSKVIQFLKKHDKSHETAMLYVSDHGESLGEYGMYLHGAPRAFAPKVQTHVASVVWVGSQFDYSLNDLKPYADKAFSHEDLFCTLLLAYEMDADECIKSRQLTAKYHTDTPGSEFSAAPAKRQVLVD